MGGKSKSTTFLLCYFLGILGVHRFYTGKMLTGILMILTFGGFGIWWLIDMVRIAAGRFRDKEGNDLSVGPPNPDFPYAGFWVRLAAISVDSLIITIATMAIAVPLLILTGGLAQLAQGQEPSPVVSLAQIVITLGYFVALTASRHQATIGKQMFGIYVVPAKGGKVSVLRSTGRFFAYILSYVTFFIGFIIAAFHKEKRALHDLLAGTVVMYGKPDESVVAQLADEEAPAAVDEEVIEEAPEPEPEPEPLPVPVHTKAAASASTRGPMLAIVLGVILLVFSVAQQFL